MITRQFIFVVLAAVGLIACGQKTTVPNNAAPKVETSAPEVSGGMMEYGQNAALNILIKEAVESPSIAALGVVRIDESAAMTIGYAGIRDVETKVEVAEDDLWHLGSNSKAFTGYLAAIAVKEGLIQWDTKILEIFPECSEGSQQYYRDKTLQDLLSHRAGMRALTSGLEIQMIPELKGTTREIRRQFVKYMLGLEPQVPVAPAIYTYSNGSYGVAAAMLEQVMGKEWETLLQEKIGKPLNIDFKFGWPVSHGENPRGHFGYTDLIPHADTTEYGIPTCVSAAGDISLSLLHYGRWLREHIMGLQGQSDILDQKAFEFIHLGLPEYAMGWLSINNEKSKVSTHDGTLGTFYCSTLIDHKKMRGSFMISNSAGEKIQPSFQKIRLSIHKED